MIPFGTPSRHLAECASTNDEARDWALDSHDPAPSGALVTAEFQRRGRGQRGRDWEAAAGQSALLSFVYRPLPGREVRELSLVTALAVAEALERGTSLRACIKWPNDILLDGCKTAGILVEAAAGSVILGIGVNVNQEHFAGSAEYAYPPTSLRLATGQSLDVPTIVAAVAESLMRWEDKWCAEGFAAIIDACRRRLAQGASVRRGTETAELVGLSADGSAEVRLQNGTFTVWATVD